MIIQSLQAQHFSKYEELLLNNLPNDLIIIAGQHTTGKSSVLSALIFALFGDSPYCDDLTRLIRWGSDYLQTRIAFQCHDQSYYITRALNQDGQALASLYHVSDQQELANSPETVAEVLAQLTGLEYARFIRLHTDGKESRQSALSSDLVQALANVQAYQQLNQQLEKERAAYTQNTEQLEHKHQHLNHAQQTYVGREDEALVQVHHELIRHCQHHDELSDQMGEEVMHYCSTHETYWRAKLGINKVRGVSHVFYLLGVGLGILAAVLWLFPEYLPLIQGGSALSFVGGAGLLLAISALLFVFSGLRIIQALYPLQRRSGVLSQRLFEAVRLQKNDLSYDLSTQAQAWYQQQNLPCEDKETFADAAYLESWSGGVEQYDIAPSEVLDVSQALRVNLAARHQRLLNLVRLLEQDLNEQQVQQDQQVSLLHKLNKHDQQLEGMTQQEQETLTAQALLSRVQLQVGKELNEQLNACFSAVFTEKISFDHGLILHVLEHAKINLRSPVALSHEQQIYLQFAIQLTALKAWQQLNKHNTFSVCFDELENELTSSQASRLLTFVYQSLLDLDIKQCWWVQGDIDRSIATGLFVPCRLGKFDLISG